MPCVTLTFARITTALSPWKVCDSNVFPVTHDFLLIMTDKLIVLVGSLLSLSMGAVKIQKLIVPEVIQAGNTASLECTYSGASPQHVVQWLFNGSEPPVYQWSPNTEPLVSGILNGRIDLSFTPSVLSTQDGQILRISSLDPELSGEYTCRILDQDQGTEVRQTKPMLVFSPEKDFSLQFIRHHREIEVKCSARGLYPQPELILERDGVIFQKQQLRMWRSDGLLFDVESTTSIPLPALGYFKPEQITCRLQIPNAGYTAIKKELLYIGKECGNNSPTVTNADLRLFLLNVVLAMKLAS